jgi:hypothetical protein
MLALVLPFAPSPEAHGGLQPRCHRGAAARSDLNPGRAALEAVANPARTKELYFVAERNRRARLLGDARSASEGRRAVACIGAAATRRRHGVGRSRPGGCIARPAGAGSGHAPSHGRASRSRRRRRGRRRTDNRRREPHSALYRPYMGAMAETPETQLIEALKKVDVYGDIAPPHVETRGCSPIRRG